MSRRYTKAFIATRFANFCQDMGLNNGPAYVLGKAQVGAVFLEHNNGWQICQIANESGGQRQLTGTWENLSANELLKFMDGAAFAKRMAA